MGLTKISTEINEIENRKIIKKINKIKKSSLKKIKRIGSFLAKLAKK